MLIYHLVDFDRGQKSYDWKDDVRFSDKPYLVRPYPTKKSDFPYLKMRFLQTAQFLKKIYLNLTGKIKK